jgi:hypothetical protein
LKQCVPARQFTQLRSAQYERVQREGEALTSYVQSVRDAALVLQINESEAQVVGRIVEGLTPTQRARFVFQPLPSTFHQLEQFVVLDRNLTYADAMRHAPGTTVRAHAVRTTVANSTDRPSQSAPRRDPVSSNPVFCYYCNKPGHIQRNCYARAARNRRRSRLSSARP